MKTCTKCCAVFPATLEFFHRHPLGERGLAPACKKCRNAVARALKSKRVRPALKSYLRMYYRQNKERLSEAHKAYAHKNREQVAAKQREWREANRTRVLQDKRDWNLANRDRLRPIKRDRARFRWGSDPSFRLGRLLSHAIRESIKGRKAGRRWESLVGYSVDDVIAHLEAQFVAGMCWENYGEWHIDHIKPVSAFRFDSPDDPQFADCWRLSNLQPLWAIDNLRKGAKVA